MSEEDPLIAGGEESKGAIKLFKESIAALKLIPIDLWLAYATAYAQVFQMFGLWLILPLLLSEEYGYSDTLAGSVFGALGGVQWFYSLFLGTFIDKLGVKVAIILAGTIGIVAGIWLTFAQDEILFMFGLLILFPLGGALDHPATRIAPRRYTTDECRPAAYSILFWIMQAAQCTTFGADDAILQLSSDGAMGLTRFRQITLLGTFVCAGGLIAALFIKEKDYEGTGNEEVDPLGAKFTTWEILRSLFAHKNFWRFIGLISMTIGCRTAYRMLDAVIPKYMERTMGEGSMYGTVLLTNPLGNLVFTPLLVPLVYVFSQYTLIVFATIIV